jgi:ferritin-like protein
VENIHLELAEAGFNCGIGKDGGESCWQKFANLQKQYLNHLKHVKRTGEEKRDPPPFSPEMHGISGSKDKLAPTNLQDTEEASENDSSTDTATTSASANAIKNRFSSVKRMKRESGSVQVLNQMKKQHTENQDERRTEFSILQKILEKQIDQRQEMLNLFKVMVETKIGKKGKLPSPSDESDDE